jgi:two-component sensor histidine kinase
MRPPRLLTRALPSPAWWQLFLLSLLVLLPPGPARAGSPGEPSDSARFFRLLRQGDSVYAEKKGYGSFARALRYYDQAQELARRTGEARLLAEATFARARVYDAWNRDPARTIALFREAADQFRPLPGQQHRYFYARYLVAHAYDKVPDSLRTVQELRALRRELRALPDPVRRRVPSTVEMALTATHVQAYPLADSLLRELVRRAWVRNDPETYDYLTHYYLVQARLDVFWRRRPGSPYLDSLAALVDATPTVVDRAFLSEYLGRLYGAAGQYQPAYRSLRQYLDLNDQLINGGQTQQLRQTLVRSEQRATLQQARYERLRTLGFWGMGGSLLLISLLSGFLYRRIAQVRRQARAQVQLNQRLDEQVQQVALLNKEIQHRVKNNLHMVYSLLQMQERHSSDDTVREQLQTARLRVESIAALHNQLQQQPAAGLDLSGYLQEIITTVVSCLATDHQVVTHLQLLPLPLSASHHLALALLLNEWVTNSLKYAQPAAGQALEIRVALQQTATGYCLTYADNGRPQPPAPAGLGTQITALLVRQLGAELQPAATHPYHYTLNLPV